jgi:two-component system LytT family sensor kinase
LRVLAYLPIPFVIVLYFTINILFKHNYFSMPLFNLIEGILMISWILGTFYFFYFILVKALLRKKKIVEYILISAMSCFIISIAVFYILELNKLLFLSEYLVIKLSFKGWLIYSIYTAIIGGFGILYRFAIDWFLNLNMKEKLENLQLKSEITLLKSKLNPHFLFNTLNNIDTLIETNSKNASDYLGKLSSILRYIVYDTENEKVEIRKEIDCIKDYIELQKLRIDDNKRIVLKTPGNYEGFQIAPILLLPFVENIFKHGDFASHKNKAYIETDLKNGILYFNSANSIDKELSDKTKSKGIGIETTRKRLELLYHDLYKLEIREDGITFHVKLEIDLNDN